MATQELVVPRSIPMTLILEIRVEKDLREVSLGALDEGFSKLGVLVL